MNKVISFATYSYTLLVIAASLAKFVITFSVLEGVQSSDKFAHAIAYFGFTIIWTLFFYVRSRESAKKDFIKAMFKAAAFGVFFGMLMEVAQLTLTDYRQFDVKDGLANTIGVILALPILYCLSNFFGLIKKRVI